MTGSGDSWREREAHRRRVAAEAKLLQREPAGGWRRLVLAAAVVGWLLSLVWLNLTLPERVPTHWSGGGVPDGWSSRTSAVGFALLLPLATVVPMLWISRLVLVWPDGINAPHKEWWLERPRRLIRFERLLREDLMVIVALTLGLFVAISLIIGYAAHQPGGVVPAWWFPVLVVAYLAVLTAVTVRIYTGSRYRPDDHDRELA